MKRLASLIVLIALAAAVSFGVLFSRTSEEAWRGVPPLGRVAQTTRIAAGEGAEIVLLRAPEGAEVEVVDLGGGPRTVANAALDDAVIVMNGGYFGEDHAPSGYLVASGRRVGGRSFDAERSAVFSVRDGIWSIDEPAESPDGDRVPDHAVQSYPVLVRDGKAAVSEDSGLVARRSAVGISEDGGLYFMITSRGLLTLYEFAQALANGPVRFASALNLDGGTSSGVAAVTDEGSLVLDSLVPVGNVIVVR